LSDTLIRGFAAVAKATPESLALIVDDEEIRYGELARRARSLAAKLPAPQGGGAARVGVLAGRNAGAYAGVLGAWWAGATYAPLGLGWPDRRLVSVPEQLRLDALIVDANGARRINAHTRAVCPDLIIHAETAISDPPADAFEPIERERNEIAYIIFTSGTTGPPKGVQIPVGAIVDHLAVIQAEYGFTAGDRVSLAFDLTFDPSILNMLMTWNAGASLHVAPAKSLLAPAAFIQDHALTVWNSAPTVVGLAARLGVLKPGALPSLRISIFGGDTLTLSAAEIWRQAAPNSVIDNVYGPTEATIECLRQRLTEPPIVTPERGAVALGLPYPGVAAAIVDHDRRFLPAGETGELAIAGTQLAVGYLDRPDLTAAKFPTIGGVRWYMTGDKAYQDAAGRFHHLGRLDDQIKIRGHRVELGEIEGRLREAAGAADVAAVGWPIADGGATDITAFVVTPPGAVFDADALRAALQRVLPSHMVPKLLREVAALPLTAHGKLDRAALVQALDAEVLGLGWRFATHERTSAPSPRK
jgi:D-alanine--poly(phosphoribitol) ligase subunit 1